MDHVNRASLGPGRDAMALKRRSVDRPYAQLHCGFLSADGLVIRSKTVTIVMPVSHCGSNLGLVGAGGD